MAADYRFQAYWELSIGGAVHRLPIVVADQEGKLSQWLARNRTLVDAQLAAAFPASQIHPSIAEPYSGHPQSDARSISIPNWPTAPPLEVNTVYVPTGLTRYTRAAFLVTTTVKDLIVAYKATGARMPRMHVHCSESDTGNGRTIYLEPLSPRPLSPYLESLGTAFGTDEMLWLLPMVDIRYFWQNKSTTSFSALSTSSWQSLIEAMANQITTEIGAWGFKASGGAGDGPLRGETVEAEYLVPHPVPFRHPLNLVAALESAAWSINRRWVHGEAFDDDTGNDAMRAIGPAAAAAQLPNSLAFSYGIPAMFATQVYNRLTRGGDFDSGIRPTPGRIAFNFPCYDNGIFSGTNERSYSGVSGEYSTFPQVADTSGTVTAIDQSVVVLTAFGSTSSNYASTNGTHANSTDLTNLVQKYSQDWYSWRSRGFDYTFAGVVPWNFSGYEDAALFYVGSPLPDGGQRIETRVWSLPPDVVCRTQLSRSTERGTAIAGAGSGSVGQSFYEDPDESLPRSMVGRLVYAGGQLRVAVNGLVNSNVLLKQANIMPGTLYRWAYDSGVGLHAKTFKVDGSPSRAYADFTTMTDFSRDGREVLVIQGSSGGTHAWTAIDVQGAQVDGT